MSTTTSKPLKPKRGTTAQNNNYTGEAYEVTLDTDKKTLVVHDGLTAGGFPLARADEVAAKDAAQDAAIAEAKSSAEAASSAASAALPKAGGTMSGVLNMGKQQIHEVASIELSPPATATHGGYIDFHFAGSSDDYTSRISEDITGGLHLLAPTNGVRVNHKHIVRSVNGVAADAEGNVKTVHSSGDGWIRYEDGLQLCFGVVIIPAGSSSKRFSYPVAFIARPATIAQYEAPENSVDALRTRHFVTVDKTWFAIFARDHTYNTYDWDRGLSYIAIGRWK